MSLLDPSHRSPLDPPIPKSKEQREQEALHEAMEADRNNLTDPAQVRITVLEAKMAQVEAAAALMGGMRGDFPMKVTDNVVSIDPSALNKDGELLTQEFDAWESGALAIWNVVVR